MHNKAKNYFLEKLIFPKVVVIDRPGVIVNRHIRKVTKNILSQTRSVFFFEKFIIDLYEGVKDVHGPEEADLLWYRITKNAGIRFSLFSKGWNRVPDFILPDVLKRFFYVLSTVGLSFAERFEMDRKKGWIVTYGRNCVVCRKIKRGCLAAGNLSAAWSSFNAENIEAEYDCSDCPNCKIMASKDIPIKCKVDLDALRPMKDYAAKNFVSRCDDKGYASFGDFVKFGKICFDEGLGVFRYKGFPISYLEVGLLEIIAREYFLEDKEKLFREILLKSSEDLISNFVSDNLVGNLYAVENMLSAFGWGIFKRGIADGKIVYKVDCPPICKYGSFFRMTVLNGFLNGALGEKLEIEKFDDYRYVFRYVS